MKSWSAQSGYTIVEVMVVLAVSGAILVSSMLVVSGKQQRTEFQQGINDMNSMIHDTINGVASGFYPNVPNNGCHQLGGGSGRVNFDGTTREQGTNLECIYMGKMIFFNGTVTKRFSLVGVRVQSYFGTQDQISQSLQKSQLVLADKNNLSGGWGTPPDMTDTYANNWQAKVTRIVETKSTNPIDSYALIFINKLGSQDSLTNSINTSFNGVTIGMARYVTPATPNSDQVQSKLNLDVGVAPALSDPLLTQLPDGGVTICLDSQSGVYGRILVGGGNSPYDTTVIVDAAKLDWTNAGCIP